MLVFLYEYLFVIFLAFRTISIFPNELEILRFSNYFFKPKIRKWIDKS
jgi:hypothetical protein